jgi:hypothetical protein
MAGTVETMKPTKWAVYAGGLLLAFHGTVDALTNLYPFFPGEAAWRYGAIGLLSNFFFPISAGVLVWTAASLLWRDRGPVVIGFGVNAFLALLCLALPVLLLLDALQINSSVPPADAWRFKVGVGKAGLKLGVTFLAHGLLAFAGWRLLRSTKGSAAEEEVSPLIRAKD